jgi:hypothetical protein
MSGDLVALILEGILVVLAFLLGRVSAYGAGYDQATQDMKMERELRALLTVMRPGAGEDGDG